MIAAVARSLQCAARGARLPPLEPLPALIPNSPASACTPQCASWWRTRWTAQRASAGCRRSASSCEPGCKVFCLQASALAAACQPASEAVARRLAPRRQRLAPAAPPATSSNVGYIIIAQQHAALTFSPPLSQRPRPPPPRPQRGGVQGAPQPAARRGAPRPHRRGALP